MRRGFAASIILSVIAWSTALVSQMRIGPQTPVPAHIEVPEGGVTLPMQDMGGRPVVDLMINAKGPYRFILDTGAVTTVVSEELSRDLSLSPLEGVQVASATGGPPPTIVMITDVRIGPAVLKGMIAAIRPLAGLLSGENAPRGILSAASFPGYLLTFDYPGKRISIMKGALRGTDSKTSFQYGEDQVLPTLPIRIAGHDTEVHLDTGSGYGLTLPTKFLKELPLASQPKEVGKVRTGGGEFPVSIARVDGTIELGQYKLDISQVSFSDAHPGSGPAVGNIGYEVLSRFVVTLDSKNRRIKIEGLGNRTQAVAWSHEERGT
jgi:hypothetical protein